MATRNDITGDAIQSRTNNKKFADNWDKIFGKNKEDKKEDKKDVKNENL